MHTFIKLTHVDGFFLVVNVDAINYYHTSNSDHGSQTDITMRDGEVIPVSETKESIDNRIHRLGPESLL